MTIQQKLIYGTSLAAGFILYSTSAYALGLGSSCGISDFSGTFTAGNGSTQHAQFSVTSDCEQSLNKTYITFTTNNPNAGSSLTLYGFTNISYPSNTTANYVGKETVNGVTEYIYEYQYVSTGTNTTIKPGTPITFETNANITNSPQVTNLQFSDTSNSELAELQPENDTGLGTTLPTDATVTIASSDGSFSKSFPATNWQNIAPQVLSLKNNETYNISIAANEAITASPSQIPTGASGTTVVKLTYPLVPDTVPLTIPSNPNPQDTTLPADIAVNVLDTTTGQEQLEEVPWNASATSVLLNTNGLSPNASLDNYQVSVAPVIGNGEIYDFNVNPSVIAAQSAAPQNIQITTSAQTATTSKVSANVSGLPGGTLLDLNFHNADGVDYNELVGSGSNNLSLPINSYDVGAQNIVINNTVYSPVISPSQIAVNGGNDTSLNIAYAQQAINFYHPYIDMTLESGSGVDTPLTNIQNYSSSSGVNDFTLAFIAAEASPQTPPAPPTVSCNAAWGGSPAYLVSTSSSDPIVQQLNAARNANVNYIISFGGFTADAGNQDLSEVCSSASDLATQYQNVINAYQPQGLDFDIESGLLYNYYNGTDNNSIPRMMQAIAQIQQTNHNLAISFTIPVTVEGLNQADMKVLNEAISAGVTNFKINMMAMDYDPNDSLNMAEYAENAITAPQDTVNGTIGVLPYLESVYPYAAPEQLMGLIEVTPMIGINDLTNEAFSLQDAQAVYNYAVANGLGGLAVWSINRDKPCPTTTTPDSNLCSGFMNGVTVPTQENNFDFSKVFLTGKLPN